MTRNEHALMVAMFTKQARQIKVLYEVLKSRDILQGDDLEAFTAIVESDPLANRELSIETVKDYTDSCHVLDISY
jgi:hypothetical protein